MNGILIITLLMSLLTQTPQTLRQIYDGRKLPSSPAQKKVTQADRALFKQEILPAARRQWREQTSQCDKESGDNFQIIDVAPGSFTKPRRLSVRFSIATAPTRTTLPTTELR